MSADSTTLAAREKALKALCDCGLKPEAAQVIVDSTQDESVLAEMTADGAQFLHDYWVKNKWEVVRHGCPNANALVKALKKLGFRDQIVYNIPMIPGLPWFWDPVLGWIDRILRNNRSYSALCAEQGKNKEE